MDPDQEAFYRRLAATPEADVRYNVNHGGYTGRHKRWASQWIDELDRGLSATATARAQEARAVQDELARSHAAAAAVTAEASRKQAAAATESNRIAREANALAEAANAKAHTANTIATLAMIFAVIAIAVSVIQILFPD